MNKPPYRVPSMQEIVAIPWNGYYAASTFSGCGGSSLGYRMAGFRVVWANEFIAAARVTYRLNASPSTILDDRDIRVVTPGDVLAATGLGEGDLDILDGSPPCASFATAGVREKGWGQRRKYSDTVQRSDDLFFEFARLVKGIQPRVFVAENVSGLVKGAAKGYFIEVMQTLKGGGYRVGARLLDASWLGVPQARQRVIFIGVRNDLDTDPVFPAPLPYQYTVRDVLPHIAQQADNGGFGAGKMRPSDYPSPTIGASPQTGNGRFPASKVVATGPACDPETGARIVLDDTAVGRDLYSIRPGGRSRKYIQNSRAHPDRPASTVSARGGAGGIVTEHPPYGCRKFTLGELRVICGFPEDFQLTGSFQQRWERLGRAVPPIMMARIATTIRDDILDRVPVAP